MRRTLKYGPALVASLWTASALAQSAPTSRLDYQRRAGAERCPDEPGLRAAVAARLGYEPFVPTAPTLVVATIARSGRGLRALIEVRDASGQLTGSREITSTREDCSELASAMALAISLAVDPLSLTRAAPPPPPTPVVPEPPPPPPPRVEPPPPAPAPPPPPRIIRVLVRPPPPSRPDPITAHATVGALLAVGSAPALGQGISASVGLRWRSVSLSVEGRADLPVTVPGRLRGTITTSLLLASLVPCFQQDTRRFGVLLACPLGVLGAMRAQSAGVDQPGDGTVPFGAIGARLGYETPALAFVSFRIRGDLFATVVGARLLLHGAETWSTPQVFGAVGLDAVFHFR